MSWERFLDPPQKNVTASSLLAAKALTFSTSQSGLSARSALPVSGSP